MSILVVADHNHQTLRPATLNAVGAATKLGQPITVLVAGHQAAAVAQAAAVLPGVVKVLHADDARYAHFLAEPLAALIAQLAPGYTHVLAAATAQGKNVMPRAAALCDVALLADITSVVSADTFVRPIYAGNALATVQSSDKIKFITVRMTAFEPVATTGGAAAVETVGATPCAIGTQFISQELSKSERPELTAARVVVSGGRALGSADAFKTVLEPLADKLNAAIGASRAAVDAGYVPNDYQVGQTGKVVAPELYIAIGISGAIQHLAGMKDSKVIVAINKDGDAPIFSVADYGLVGDLFQIVPELVKQLA
ncbi:MAG: FAD-binding protein [Alphaproteobacteria bacterium]|nr:FAD-binding protein [Alphaproteobacteria bacterium]